MSLLATLTGTVTDVNSNPVPGAVITVALWNYGNNTPTANGGAIIVTPIITVSADGSGNFSTQVYGNDIISPLGTVYTVTYASQNRITVSTATYTFNSNGVYNLNSFAPNVTYPLPVTFGPVNATQLQGRTISTTAPTDGQALKWVAANSDWEPGAVVAGVTSVFGRSGAITAQSGDYSFSQISGTASAAQYVVMVGDSGTGGTQGAVPAPAAGDAAASKFLKADGTWTVTPGAVTSVFTRTGAVVAAANDYSFAQLSGNIAVTQMNSGTSASSGTFWRGDGTWAAVVSGVSSVFTRTGAITAAANDYTMDLIGSAAANFTQNNAGFTATFNHTSAVNWTWANTTAATNVASQSSPIFNINGTYWNGSVSATDSWTLQNVLANGTNGTSTLTFAHSGSSGTAAVSVPILSATTVLATNLGTSGSPIGDTWLASGHVHILTTSNWNSFEGQNGADVGFNFYSSKVNALFNLNGIQSLGWLSQTFHVGNADVNLSRMASTYLSLGNGVAGDSSGNLSLGGITGSCVHSRLATTPNPTVAVLVGSGATTWGYKLVAKDALGSSVASSEVTVANNANLTNGAANKITAVTTPGAQSYDVYRTTAGTSPNTTGKIGSISTGNLNNSTFLVDAGVLTLSAAANASGGTTVYTGTLSNIPVNNLVGAAVTVAGFVTGANNGGPFTCTANTTTTLTLANASGVAETHAGTATQAGDGTTAPAVNTTGTLKLAAGFMDSTATVGSSGQVLSSTGTATQWINQSAVSGNAVSLQGVSVATTTPQTGDTLRYNEYGDSKWDVTGGPRPFIFGRSDGHNISMASLGTVFTTYVITSSTGPTVNLSSATEPSSLTVNTGAAGTTTGRGINEGNTSWTFGTFLRISTRCQLQQTTNVRYWIGAGINLGVANAVYSTDTPNTSYIAFRYSAGTDTTIKAVCGTATASQTVVDTGVSVDTSASKVFEIAYDGTNVNFYIGGVLKAQISTNLPATSALITSGVAVDNQNTANNQSFNIMWIGVMLK